jgi:hypothetical protein
VTNRIILFLLLTILIINIGCVGLPDKDDPDKTRLDLEVDPLPESPEDSAFDDLEPIIVLGAGETVKQLKTDLDNDGIQDDEDLCGDGTFADDRIDGPPNDRGVYKDIDGDNIRDACDTCASQPGVFSDNRVDENQNTVADMCESDLDNDNIPDFKDLCPDGVTFADDRIDDKDGNKVFEDKDNDKLRDVCDFCPDKITLDDDLKESPCGPIFSCPTCTTSGQLYPPKVNGPYSQSAAFNFGGYKYSTETITMKCSSNQVIPTSTGAGWKQTTKYVYSDSFDGGPENVVKEDIPNIKGNKCSSGKAYGSEFPGGIQAPFCNDGTAGLIYSDVIPCSNFGKGFVCKEKYIPPTESSPGYLAGYCAHPSERDEDNDGIEDTVDLCPNGETFADNRKDGNNDGISDDCVQTFESCPEGLICLSESTVVTFVEIEKNNWTPIRRVDCKRTPVEPTSKGAVLTLTHYDYKDGGVVLNFISQYGNECVLNGKSIKTTYCYRSIPEDFYTEEGQSAFKSVHPDKFIYESNSIPCSNFGEGFVCNYERNSTYELRYRGGYCGPPK